MSKDQASSSYCFFMFVLTVGLLACWSVPAHAYNGAWFQDFETLSEHHDFESLQAPCRGIPRFQPPKRVILDHDGAFEAYYAILAAALESQHRRPNIELIAVTLSAVGEDYCPGSNGFHDQKEGSIADLTEKVLSIVGYSIPVYAGCGEAQGTVEVDEVENKNGNIHPTGKTLTFRVELPFGGLEALAPCRHHVEVPFFPDPEPQCYYEFPKYFRNETQLFVKPTADQTLQDFGLPQFRLLRCQDASTFLAKQMCDATRRNPLTVLTVGPLTNLARAYQKIEQNPEMYGCQDINQLKCSVRTVHMGGVWDAFPANNFEIVPLPGVVGPEHYLLNEIRPTWTVGNIYYENALNAHVFSSHHVPLGAPDVPSLFLNRDVFDALNNAEFNFFVDSYAVEKVMKSGVPARFVALNASNNVPLRGFADRLDKALASGRCVNEAPAQFIRDLQRSNAVAFENLSFWDTLATVSVWQSFVYFQPFSNLKVTTLTSGQELAGGPDIWPRDAGRLYQEEGGSDSVEIGLEVIRQNPEVSSFKEEFQDFLFDLICHRRTWIMR